MKYHERPAPATDADLRLWETEFGTALPPDLRRLLRESDGPVLYDAATQKELQFLSARDAVEYYEAYQFAEYCPEAIPIALDGSGNFAVYRRGAEGVFGMSSGNLGWHDTVGLADDVDGLIALPGMIERLIYP
jgi:hypothetical protein